MNDVIEVNDSVISSLIMTIRGVPVMLDRDLAALYGVEVKHLNRQVKRNRERFPDDFMLQLSKDECSRCQIGTMKEGRGSNIKYCPYAFTENGIAMLSSVLRSNRAIEVNIKIMREFVAVRKSLHAMSPVISRLETVERRQITDQSRNEARFDKIFAKMSEGDVPDHHIFYQGRHDRFIIADQKEVFLIGASLKDAGRLTFAATKMDPSVIPGLLSSLH